MHTHTLWGEGIAGALYTEDFYRLVKAIRFTDPKVLSSNPVTILDDDLAKVVVDLAGDVELFAITHSCFKLPKQLETPTQEFDHVAQCEDYGHIAVYEVCT